MRPSCASAGVFLQQLEGDHIEGALLTGLQAHRRSHPILIGLEPATGAHAPVVAGLKTWEAVLGQRGAQVVPLGTGVREKALIHDTAHRVASKVSAIGAAVTIAIPTGHRLTAAHR